MTYLLKLHVDTTDRGEALPIIEPSDFLDEANRHLLPNDEGVIEVKFDTVSQLNQILVGARCSVQDPYWLYDVNGARGRLYSNGLASDDLGLLSSIERVWRVCVSPVNVVSLSLYIKGIQPVLLSSCDEKGNQNDLHDSVERTVRDFSDMYRAESCSGLCGMPNVEAAYASIVHAFGLDRDLLECVFGRSLLEQLQNKHTIILRHYGFDVSPRW